MTIWNVRSAVSQNLSAYGMKNLSELIKKRKNVSLDWFPSDTSTLFAENMKNKKTRKQLEIYGWLENKIKYNFNEHGYRSQSFDFNNPNSIIFLGCSYTMGIGVNYEDAWAPLVAKNLGVDCYNFGEGGGSLDTMFRTAQEWLPKFKSKFVIALEPPGPRYEVFDSEGKNRSYFATRKKEPIDILRYTVDYNHALHLDKTFAALELLSAKNKKTFIGFTSGIWQNSMSRGRDLMHPGAKCHEKTATLITQLIEKRIKRNLQ